MTVSNNHRVINFVICIWGCRARFTMAGKKDFFGRLVRTYGAAFATRWRLKANHSRRASGDLARLAKIEHLSAFHKVLGTHNTAEAIFLRRTSELSLLLLRENHVPVIPISFRNGFLKRQLILRRQPWMALRRKCSFPRWGFIFRSGVDFNVLVVAGHH